MWTFVACDCMAQRRPHYPGCSFAVDKCALMKIYGACDGVANEAEEWNGIETKEKEKETKTNIKHNGEAIIICYKVYVELWLLCLSAGRLFQIENAHEGDA